MSIKQIGTVVIDFDQFGTPVIEGVGFADGACHKAVKPFEEAFGITDANRKARATVLEKPEAKVLEKTKNTV